MFVGLIATSFYFDELRTQSYVSTIEMFKYTIADVGPGSKNMECKK